MNKNSYLFRIALALAIMGVPVSIECAEVKKTAAQDTLASQKPKYSKSQFEFEMFNWASDGEISKVKLALENGIDVNTKSAFLGETMLMNAVSNGRFDLVTFLLEQGADVNVQSDSGMTALMYSAGFQEKDEIAQLLLDHGANVLLKNYDGETAYDIAREYENENIAKLLEPLILAPVKRKLERKTTNKQDERIKTEKKKAEQLQTLFSIWARDGDEENVKMALDNGININAKDDSGNTALIEAASGGQVEMINLLLAKGAHINAKNNRGDTALMNAAKEGHDLAVEMLLNKGAAIELKNNADDTAYDIAKEHGYEDIALLLKQWARAKDRARMERGTV